MDADDCLLCRKHDGQEPQPPGGYILRKDDWLVCHAPIDKGPLGTLFVESRRHILDNGDFNDREMATFAPMLRRVYAALRSLIHPQRIYLVSLMEGIAHFHAWIVPRMTESPQRGMAFLALDLTCGEAEAAQLAHSLRSALTLQWSAS